MAEYSSQAPLAPTKLRSLCPDFTVHGAGSIHAKWEELSGHALFHSEPGAKGVPDNLHQWAIVTDDLRNGYDTTWNAFGGLRMGNG